MRWPIYIALLLAACFVFSVGYKFQSDCYEIYAPDRTTEKILLNKCTGETWMLVHTPAVGGKEGEKDGFTFRWYQLSRDYGGEVLLTK